MTPNDYFQAVERRQMHGSLGDYTGYSYRDCTPAELDGLEGMMYPDFDRRDKHRLLRHANFCLDCGQEVSAGAERCWLCSCAHRGEGMRDRYAEGTWHNGRSMA